MFAVSQSYATYRSGGGGGYERHLSKKKWIFPNRVRRFEINERVVFFSLFFPYNALFLLPHGFLFDFKFFISLILLYLILVLFFIFPFNISFFFLLYRFFIWLFFFTVIIMLITVLLHLHFYITLVCVRSVRKCFYQIFVCLY